jgi:hypothetical protein
MKAKTGVLFGACLLTALVIAVPAIRMSAAEPLERFSAFVVNLPGAQPGDRTMSGVMEITIERWSTAAERKALVDAFLAKGQDGLLKELSTKKAAGYLKLPNTLRYDLRFSRQLPGEDGGRRIIMATDRLMTAREAINQPRTVDYPFTILELRVNRENKGEGRFSALTKIVANKKQQVVEIENYGDAPARMTEVKPLAK